MNYNIFTVNDMKRFKKNHGPLAMSSKYVNEQTLIKNCKLYKSLIYLLHDTLFKKGE
jgi:hypothetical protein